MKVTDSVSSGRRLARMVDLERALGLKKSAIHARIALGLCIKPVALGPRAARYPSDEIAALVDAHAAGLNDCAIKALVKKLHEARVGVAAGLTGA